MFSFFRDNLNKASQHATKTLNFARPYATKAWNFANGNLVSILLGGIVSHQLTKSYRDEEIKLLTKDIDNLKDDLRNREEDTKKVNLANDLLRTNYMIQSTKLLSCETMNIRYENSLSEYKSAYNDSWCFLRKKPKVSPREFLSEKDISNNNSNNQSPNSKI